MRRADAFIALRRNMIGCAGQRLGQNVFEHMAADIGEAEIPAAETVSQLFVIKTQQVQNGCLEVVHMDLVFNGLLAELIG